MYRGVSMRQNGRPPDTQQPLALGSFRNWVRVLRASGGVERAFLRRACFISSVSLMTIPLRAWERLGQRSLHATQSIDPSPIFIVGHWRSGTTLLHQLLARDPGVGYVSTFQSIAPEWFMLGGRTIKGLLARAIPATRMMDNVKLSLDDPQEEEFAIAEMSPFSFYHQWSFPRNARDYFEKYALFRNVPEAVIQSWKNTYLSILRKAAFHTGLKRLVIKNPVNTARIRILLELFPDAKFIHVYRNPYVVFLSTRHFFQRVLAVTQLQQITQAEIEANIFHFYREMMGSFLADKELIPPENLVEIPFEELEMVPLAALRWVYACLGLPEFAAAEAGFRSQIESLAGYQRNRYNLSQDVIRKVEKQWGFTIDRWGYEPPTSAVNGLIDRPCLGL